MLHMQKRTQYHPLSKFLHWSVVFLVSIQFLTSFIMSGIGRNISPDSFLNLHMSFGVFVAPIAITLLIMRYVSPVEDIALPSLKLQDRLASAMHYILYILLVIIPLSGDAFASSHGVTVRVFGLFDLPSLFANGSSLGRTISEVHSFLAWTIGVLVLGHIIAALYHHYVMKDPVLVRMLPSRGG